MLLLQVLQGGIKACRIPTDNIGYKLLKKMGWTGGPVGKNQSKSVPQMAPLIGYDDRTGLGFAWSRRLVAFRPAVKNTIAKFVRSGRHDDLVFSSALTSEERDIVCAEACKNHLQFRCYNKPPAVEDIYVVVSLQRSPMEIVNYLLKNGEESNKYRLLKPCKVQS